MEWLNDMLNSQLLQQLWGMKFSIVILFVAVGCALATRAESNQRSLFFPLMQLNYVMLRFRQPNGNVWPGFLAYVLAPVLGFGVVFLLFWPVSNYLDTANTAKAARPALGRLWAAGLVLLYLVGIVLLENLFEDTRIVGQGVHGHMLSDQALADESGWGFVLYIANSIQVMSVVAIVGLVLVVIAPLLPERFRK